jgi:hypothetical protein
MKLHVPAGAVMDNTVHLLSQRSNASHSFLITKDSYFYYTKLHIFVT